jgi:Ser-tRNA(Ala) deacylase AlaX
MKTKPLYLENSYLKTMTATVLEAYPESVGKWKMILSETVFYPMGGGQPTDQGILYGGRWQGRVYQVLVKDGQMVHYVESEIAPPMGVELKGEIDWKRRYDHMRLHSAGHVVDFAVYLLGYSPGLLRPLKADHGKRPTIEYQGVVSHDFQAELQAKVDFLVLEDLSFSTQFASYDELQRKAIYLQPNLPTHKQLRLLTLETVGTVADGGTQVHRTADIGPIQILSIKIKEGMTSIRYAITHKDEPTYASRT